MNVQAHMSGQVPGHVPNTTAAQLTQRSGNPSAYPVQTLGPTVGATSSMTMDQDLVKARSYVQEKM